jgi:hypothetical protein
MEEFFEFKEGDSKLINNENKQEISKNDEEIKEKIKEENQNNVVNIENNKTEEVSERVEEKMNNEIIMINNDENGHASLPPLIFNPNTHNPLPSISPRETEYKDDKKSEKAMKKYLEKHPEISLLIQEMNLYIINSKPENILQYLSENFFHEDKLTILADKIKPICDDIKKIPSKNK